jgi:outer membrane protein
MSKQLLKMSVLLIGVTLVVVKSRAQPKIKHEFTIQQTLEYAHKNNVQVKNALINVQIQEQTNRDVTSVALPAISGNLGVTDYLNIPTSLLPGEIFGQPAGTFIPVKFGTKYNSTAGIQLKQILFDGQVFIALKARTTTIDFQNKNVEVTEEAIKTNIYKIYYTLAASNTQIGLLDANITRLEKLEHDAKILYQNGFAEKLDIDKVSVQLANLQTEKIKTLNTINNGYIGLKILMGMPANDSLILLDKITEEQFNKDYSGDSLYQYEDRKEYQYITLAKKLNEYNIRRFQLSQIPTISLNGSYSKNAQRNTFDFVGAGDWFTTSYVGASVAIPIFDGFSKKARISKSKLELQQTENQLENLKLTIDGEVEQARANFKSSLLTMSFQKRNMQLAENVYNQTKKKFDAGTGSNTEISTTQTDLFTAQTNYISAMYTAIIARVDYLRATGKL